MAYVTVDVDVHLDEFDDDEIVEYLQCRGYTVSKGLLEEAGSLDREEIDLLIAHIDIRELPLDWQWQRIRDKLMAAKV
jgi:hypothetical protein